MAPVPLLKLEYRMPASVRTDGVAKVKLSPRVVNLACRPAVPGPQKISPWTARAGRNVGLRVLNTASEVLVEEPVTKPRTLTVPELGPLPGFVQQGPLDSAKGKLTWLAVMATSFPIWVREAAKLGFGYVATGGKVMETKDRSTVDFKDPFPGMEHEFIDVNNVRLHVVRAAPKKPGQKLMLMVHGFPEAWYSWHYQMEEFKDDYEVVAFDMRGYGKSSKPEGRDNYRIEYLVADVVALVHALGHESCVLVAHDWGGMISWCTAALHPEMVEKLVACALPHPTCWQRNFDADQQARSWYMKLFQAPTLPETMMSAADYAWMGSLLQSICTPEEVEAYKAYMARPGHLTGSINYYRALFDVQYRHPSPQYVEAMERLGSGKLPMPVLMLYAENDIALGTQLLKGTEELVPNLELHVLPSGHWITLEKPKEVNSYMRAFLTKTA